MGAGAYEAWSDNHQERVDKEEQAIVDLPRLFGKGRCGLLETAYKEKIGERAGVVFPSLCGKPEEDEEDKRANDARPLGEG